MVWTYSIVTKYVVSSSISCVLRYIRMFIEELCFVDKNDALDNVEKHAKVFLDKYGDSSLLLIHWETLFFSHKYSHQLLSDEFLKRNPGVAKEIDFDSVLGRAIKYKMEHFLCELLQIALDFDLDRKIKTKTLSALLSFYCETGNTRAATERIKKAVELDIPVDSASKSLYEHLISNSGIVSRLFAYFNMPRKT